MLPVSGCQLTIPQQNDNKGAFLAVGIGCPFYRKLNDYFFSFLENIGNYCFKENLQ